MKPKKRFLMLPVVEPNGVGGSTVVGCKSEEGDPIGYPADQQTHMFVYAAQVVAIVPCDHQQASFIYVAGNNTAHKVFLPAEQVAKEIESFLFDHA